LPARRACQRRWSAPQRAAHQAQSQQRRQVPPLLAAAGQRVVRVRVLAGGTVRAASQEKRKVRVVEKARQAVEWDRMMAAGEAR